MEIFILFICLARYSAALNKDMEINMLADVIRFYKSPSIIANLCWTPHDKTALMNLTATVDYPVMIKIVNIAKMFDDAPEHHIIFLVDEACNDSYEIFREANKTRVFRFPFRWIILGPSVINEFDVPTKLSGLQILTDSEVVVASKMNNHYVLHLVYTISINKNWRSEYFGTWKPESGFTVSKALGTSTAMRRLDLRGQVVPTCFVTTVEETRHFLEIRGGNDKDDSLTKVNFHITNNLLDFMNAGRKWCHTGTWGYKVNGSWNGLMGYFVREEIEIGGTPMFIVTERLPVVEYISSPTSTRPMFIFQQPNLSYQNNLFLLSFRAAVWYSTICLVFLLFLVLLLVASWEWKKKRTDEARESDAGILRANMADVVILVLGAVCQQSSTVELKGSLGRVVILVQFIALMFLYNSYSANIVALLQSSSDQIQTLEDLLNSRMKCAVQDNVYNRHYFPAATEPIRKALYEKKIAPPGVAPRFLSMEEGVMHIQKGLFAFHMEPGVGYKYVQRYFHESEKCRLKEIQFLQVLDPWTAIRKHTPYREMFKIGTKRIQEHGLNMRENLLIYEKQPKCTSSGANFVSVGLADCYPGVLVLAYGMLASLFVFAAEVLVHRRQLVLGKIECVRGERGVEEKLGENGR